MDWSMRKLISRKPKRNWKFIEQGITESRAISAGLKIERKRYRLYCSEAFQINPRTKERSFIRVKSGIA